MTSLPGTVFPTLAPLPELWKSSLAQRLVQVGIRTLNGHQLEQVKRFGVEVIEMKNWRDDLVFEFDAPVVYLFRYGRVGSGICPGVSHREPGGFIDAPGD